MEQIVAARLEPDDVGENEAAPCLAPYIAGDNVNTQPPFMGRCNLFATKGGLLLVAGEKINGANDIDEAVTTPRPSPSALSEAGNIVGTVKIIPFGTPRIVVERACAGNLGGGLSAARFKALQVAAISTLLSALRRRRSRRHSRRSARASRSLNSRS